MAAWMELAKTGPEHAELKKKVGTWTCDVKTWMKPGAPPMESKGKSVFSMALGDRFLRQDYEGEMDGQVFHGIGYTGFNQATKKYESIWMDSGAPAWRA